MNCPVCKTITLKTEELAPGLAGGVCNECGGTWIARHRYDAWRRALPGELPEVQTPVQIAVTESHKAKICPDCGRLLLPYRVGHGLPFAIDYCGGCGGVWLDRNEWTAIKAKNLHDNLHDIVSDHWQVAVRKDEVQATVEKVFQRLLGPAYDRARECRAWMLAQPQKGAILAYLADGMPKKK